jgi:histidinol phosphatase-like PHP family hydrolase
LIPQDLHIHTIFSSADSSVVPEQTVELISRVRHADTIGISDHIESIPENSFPDYEAAVRGYGFRLGAEIGGPLSVDYALSLPLDYFVYHCHDDKESYRGAEKLVSSERPLIIAHPLYLGTDFSRIAPECFVEINNRYIWRTDWLAGLSQWTDRFPFVISSDAHQPNWLSQSVARYVASELGVRETLLFTGENVLPATA